ncbi:MAG: phage minor head protein [Planctomycetota bacterium]
MDRFDGDRSLAMTNAKRSAVGLAGLTRGYRERKRRAVSRSRTVMVWFDSSGVQAVQKAQLGGTSPEAWHKMGVPVNQIIRATDAPFEELPYGEVGYKPIGLEPYGADPLDSIDDPAGPPEDPEVPEADEDAVSRVLKLATGGAGDRVERATDAQLARLWAAWRKSWTGMEQSMRGRVRRHFKGLRDGVLSRLAAAMPQGEDVEPRGLTADERRDVIGLIVFNLVEAQGELRVLVEPLLRESIRLGGEQSIREAADATDNDSADPFFINDPRINEAMRQRVPQVVGVDETLRRKLAQELAAGLEAGEGQADLAKRIKGEFNFAHKRATMIARTEVGAAVEQGRQLGRVQAGVPLKSWLWSRKETGRPVHAETERETLANPIPVEQDFILAGTTITCPHPRGTGRPDQDINCGCNTLSRYPGDSVKSLIGRLLQRGFLDHTGLVALDATRSAPASKQEAA